MTYDEALAYFYNAKRFGSRPGLDRTRELLSRLHDPQDTLKFIHVAGTNGKGSVCCMLSAILMESGLKVGTFTSPYLDRVNEQFRINGVDISDETFAFLTETVSRQADKMPDHPTEFELAAALCFLYFAQQKCDIVVLEVGMGGALDATNVIKKPEVAVIATIGLDHTQYLGTTYQEIAAVKAGIIKDGCAVAMYGKNATAEDVVSRMTVERGGTLYLPNYDALSIKSATENGLDFDYGTYLQMHLPLVGVYQANNAALAITVIGILQQKGWAITAQNIRNGLAKAAWPGRFEIIHTQPMVILDGGHNPEGVCAAIDSIRRVFPNRKVHFLLGIMADKDVPAMLKSTLPIAADYVTVTPHNPRAMAADTLAAQLCKMGGKAEAAASIAAGVKKLLQLTGSDGLACCLGSLYMSADVRKCFLQIAERGE